MTGTPVNDLRTFCEYDNTKLIIYIVIMRGNPGATNSNASTETPVRGKPRVANVTRRWATHAVHRQIFTTQKTPLLVLN